MSRKKAEKSVALVSNEPGMVSPEEVAKSEAELPPLDAIEKEEGDQRYHQEICRLKEAEYSAMGCAVELRWQQGEFLDKLLMQPGKYGNRTVLSVAFDLRVSESAVRGWHRFYKRYTREALDNAKALNLSWRAIQTLSSLVDVDERKRLELKVADNKLNSDQLRDEVKRINSVEKEKKVKKGEKVENRGGPRIKPAIANLIGFCENFQRKIAKAMTAIEGMPALAPDAYDEMRALTQKSLSALEEVKKKMTEYEEAVGKL